LHGVVRRCRQLARVPSEAQDTTRAPPSGEVLSGTAGHLCDNFPQARLNASFLLSAQPHYMRLLEGCAGDPEFRSNDGKLAECRFSIRFSRSTHLPFEKNSYRPYTTQLARDYFRQDIARTTPARNWRVDDCVRKPRTHCLGCCAQSFASLLDCAVRPNGPRSLSGCERICDCLSGRLFAGP
jgi:hypothetical protein